jgi:crossover junction endodeoxyribonuclease RusA
MIELRLPWPPSVNRIWRNVVIGRSARTLLSKDGRLYFDDAARRVQLQRQGRKIDGRAQVEIVLHAPTRAAIDIDNRAKAVLDACTKGGLWTDDSQVDVLVVRRDCVLKDGAVVVRAVEIEAVPRQAELPVSHETDDLWA